MMMQQSNQEIVNMLLPEIIRNIEQDKEDQDLHHRRRKRQKTAEHDLPSKTEEEGQ